MENNTYSAGILTVSDKGAAGEREDLSGNLACDILTDAGFVVKEYNIVPDEPDKIKDELIRMCDELKISLVVTTGGTGFSPRDVTPEATKCVIEREAFGVSQAILINSLSVTPKAMLSRGICGIRGKSLIVNLPGSPKAVKESLDYILTPIKHGLEILLGTASECGK